jgi:uncharacterized protein HemX
MSSDSAAAVIVDARPHVHLWMTTHEAAEILDVSVGVIDRKRSSGELPSRVIEDGTDEVLICLPEEPAVSVRAAMAPMIDALSDIERKLAPPPIPPALQERRSLVPANDNPRWTRSQDVRRAKRSARVAWSLAAMLLIAAGAVSVYVFQQINSSRQQIEVMAGELQRVSTHKAQLDQQLVEVKQAVQKAQGELAVERNIEDTLLQAAIRNHAIMQASSTAMVDR